MDSLIKGSSELNKMFLALQRTADSLRRDFGEVENLQQSLTSAHDFVSKASRRIEESILSDLTLVRPSAGLLTTNLSYSGDGRDEFVLALSGAENFVRGNPHFALSLALRSMGKTKIALVYSPIDERLYYAEDGAGAYVYSAFHSTRTKVSNVSVISEATIAYNGVMPNMGNGAEVRYTGCSALDLAWVATGKFDGFMSVLLDYAEIAAGELILTEAGGSLVMNTDIIATNNRIVL